MVYEGNDKYIFISYSHKDADKVLPLLQTMADSGLRFWYDSGIEAGTEWPEYIEDRLIHAEVVLVFMTPAAVESRNCRNEINFALELKKEILVVYLEETTLLKGMRLQLNSSQSLFRRHHDTQQTFEKELVDARILQLCRDGAAAPVVRPPVTQKSQPEKAVKAPAKSGKLPLYALLGAVLVAMIVLICVLAFGGGGSTPTLPPETDPPVTEPSVTEPTVIEMSDDLMDFTVQLEGVVYQFPCKYTDLTANGWTISSSGYSDTALMIGGGSDSFDMSQNGKRITVTAYNLSGNATPIADCLIAGISCEAADGAEVVLAKGVNLAMTAEQIMEQLGAPNSRNDQTDYTVFYYEDAATGAMVKFLIYLDAEDQKYSTVTIKNMIDTGDVKTETNPEKPQYLESYQAPAELGSDFKNAVVQIGGDLYCIPAPVSCFVDNGWKIVQQPSFIRSGNSDAIRLERDGAKLNLTVINGAEYQTLPENCLVYKFSVTPDDGVDVKLPNGIQIDMTREQVVAALTEEFSYYEGSYSHSWDYNDYKDRMLSIGIRVDVETQRISSITLSCENWEE